MPPVENLQSILAFADHNDKFVCRGKMCFSSLILITPILNYVWPILGLHQTGKETIKRALAPREGHMGRIVPLLLENAEFTLSGLMSADIVITLSNPSFSRLLISPYND